MPKTVIALRSEKTKRYLIKKVDNFRKFINDINSGDIEEYSPHKPYEAIHIESFVNEKDANRRVQFFHTKAGLEFLQSLTSGPHHHAN